MSAKNRKKNIPAETSEILAGPIHDSDEAKAAASSLDDTPADPIDTLGDYLAGLNEKVPPSPQTLLVKYLHPIAQDRSMLRATTGSAGLDLCACVDGCRGSTRLVPGFKSDIPTGVSVAIPEGYCGLVMIRSGANIKDGLRLDGGSYVIDSDYRGEILLPLTTSKPNGYLLQAGERVAQLVIVPVMNFPIQEVDELPMTQRGTNGIGSTGK